MISRLVRPTTEAGNPICEPGRSPTLAYRGVGEGEHGDAELFLEISNTIEASRVLKKFLKKISKILQIESRHLAF